MLPLLCSIWSMVCLELVTTAFVLWFAVGFVVLLYCCACSVRWLLCVFYSVNVVCVATASVLRCVVRCRFMLCCGEFPAPPLTVLCRLFYRTESGLGFVELWQKTCTGLGWSNNRVLDWIETRLRIRLVKTAFGLFFIFGHFKKKNLDLLKIKVT